MSHLSAKSDSDRVKKFFYKNEQIGMLCMKLIKENYKTLGKVPVKKNVCIVYYFFCLVGLFWCRTCSIKQYVPILCVWYAFYCLSLTGYTSQATCRGSET